MEVTSNIFRRGLDRILELIKGDYKKSVIYSTFYEGKNRNEEPSFARYLNEICYETPRSIDLGISIDLRNELINLKEEGYNVVRLVAYRESTKGILGRRDIFYVIAISNFELEELQPNRVSIVDLPLYKEVKDYLNQVDEHFSSDFEKLWRDYCEGIYIYKIADGEYKGKQIEEVEREVSLRLKEFNEVLDKNGIERASIICCIVTDKCKNGEYKDISRKEALEKIQFLLDLKRER